MSESLEMAWHCRLFSLCYFCPPWVFLPLRLPSEAQQIAELQRQLAWATLKIQALEAELRLARIKKYGPASESLTSTQLALLDRSRASAP